MFNIQNYLDKFVRLHKSSDQTKQILIDTINKRTGVLVKTEDLDLDIAREKVHIKCSPIFRNQIFMHKKAIELSLESQKIFLTIY